MDIASSVLMLYTGRRMVERKGDWEGTEKERKREERRRLLVFNKRWRSEISFVDLLSRLVDDFSYK